MELSQPIYHNKYKLNFKFVIDLKAVQTKVKDNHGYLL